MEDLKSEYAGTLTLTELIDIKIALQMSIKDLIASGGNEYIKEFQAARNKIVNYIETLQRYPWKKEPIALIFLHRFENYS